MRLLKGLSGLLYEGLEAVVIGLVGEELVVIEAGAVDVMEGALLGLLHGSIT